MKAVFGDSLYFLALANPRDEYHAKAVQFAQGWTGLIVTTRWVLAEVCDGLCQVSNRRLAVFLLDQLSASPRFRVVLESDDLFERGLELYRERLDKEWSLTDCISLVTMADEGLTNDHHFQQAGFIALLA